MSFQAIRIQIWTVDKLATCKRAQKSTYVLIREALNWEGNVVSVYSKKAQNNFTEQSEQRTSRHVYQSLVYSHAKFLLALLADLAFSVLEFSFAFVAEIRCCTIALVFHLGKVVTVDNSVLMALWNESIWFAPVRKLLSHRFETWLQVKGSLQMQTSQTDSTTRYKCQPLAELKY